jgi:hypothetical protein
MSLIVASAAIPLPGDPETEGDREDRYASIARDALTVAYDPDEEPLFGGPTARAETAAALLAVASLESGFRRDVDRGEGRQRGPAWCLMQIELGSRGRNGKTPLRVVLDEGGYRLSRDASEGLGGEDLTRDRQSCFRVGLRLARRSLNACRSSPLFDRLAAYTSGSCDRGKAASRARLRRARAWVARSKPPVLDALVFEGLREVSQESNFTYGFALP